MIIIEALLCGGIGLGLGWCQGVLTRSQAKAFMTSLFLGFAISSLS